MAGGCLPLPDMVGRSACRDSPRRIRVRRSSRPISSTLLQQQIQSINSVFVFIRQDEVRAVFIRVTLCL